MKVVINICYGGFGLSKEGLKLYNKLSGKKIEYCGDIRERNDPHLVKVVEKLGKKADGTYSELKIVEIPDGTDFIVEEYDGNEWIARTHETWS